MHVHSGHLRLTPKNPRGLTLPIDIFFSSLAESFGKKAVGVILSGTGTDGTRGSIALNAAGGFVLAQDPETAKFDGMPRSVIAANVVDAVLPAPRRFVWKETFTMTAGRRARWACGQAAFEPVHMSTGRY